MLEIKNLHAKAQESEILKGVNLSIKAGEIHAIMGPNGSGKSTLSNCIMGNPLYSISDGNIIFNEEDITQSEANERSHKGIFMVFQSPRSIGGVNMRSFLHSIHKSKILTAKNLSDEDAKKDKEVRKEISLVRFKKNLNEKLPSLGINEQFMERSLNEGFSGGEKKKAEVLQMKVLNPKLVILDELDSGLDVDALKVCCQEIMKLKEESDMGILLITHFTRIFDYIKPDKVHVFKDGTIVQSGDIGLAKKIESEGYITDNR